MILYITGIFLFLVSYSANILFSSTKAGITKQFGIIAWRVLVTSLAIIGILLIINHYTVAQTSSILLWQPSLIGVYSSLILNLFALWFILAAYIPKNILKIKCKYPMILGIKCWTLAHLIAKGDSLSIFIFGSTLIWVIFFFNQGRKNQMSNNKNITKRSIRSSFAVFFVGLMIWLYMIRTGHEDLIELLVFLTLGQST